MSKLITGLTPEEEQSFVESGLLTIADQKETVLAAEVLRGTTEIANAKLSGVSTDKALDDHKSRMRLLLIDLYSDSFNVFGKRILNAPGIPQKKELPSTPYFDLQMSIWLRYVSSEKVTQITNTTMAQAIEIIQVALRDSVDLGLAEDATGKLIQERIAFNGGQLSRLRGRMIARTEAHTASTASADIAAKSIGLPLKKEWISAQTERTRTTHLAANGQKVDMGAKFFVGTELLTHPGDPEGSAKEIINCRCVAGYSL